MVPLAWHAFWHVPLMHASLQHSENATHVCPLGLHIGWPHVPLLHVVQQGCVGEQFIPSGMHTAGPHVPLLQLVQHGAVVEHVLPSGMHMGCPQVPFEQTPAQHCAPFTHGAPLASHAWQMPLVHGVLQHGVFGPHIAPLGWHVVPPQMPPAQTPAQQVVAPASRQGAPFGRHIVGPHVPLTLHGPLQQGAAGLHVMPSGMHIGGPQMLLVHSPLQQGPMGLTQGRPSGAHICGPQTLLVQTPLQQGPMGLTHGVPLGAHICGPQMPLVQMLLQQSVGTAHLFPFGMHTCVVQMPLVQALLQHCVGLLHMAPSGSHMQAWPQRVVTSDTQVESHVLTQQNGSVAQILATHGSHPPVSLGPVVHSLCEQLFVMPQMPFEHVLVQHGTFTLHGTPSGRHIGLPQMPVVQTPEQQGPLHGTPFGRHCTPHCPVGPHVPEQHIAPTMHALPLGSHGPQKPLVHTPLQHWSAMVHAVSLGWQVVAHTPFMHAPEQQSPLAAHIPPGGWQLPPHTPLGPHVPEQQFVPVMQGLPSDEHGISPQTPLLQLPVQQSVSSWQAPPGAAHIGPPSPPPPPVPTGSPRLLRPQLVRRKPVPKNVASATRSQV